MKGTFQMANTTLSHDHEALRALVTHWLRQVSQKECCFTKDSPDMAAEDALSDTLSRFSDADVYGGRLDDVPTSLVFGTGVELGIRLGAAVLADPLSGKVPEIVADALETAASEMSRLYQRDAAYRKEVA
jgi:hypothetical protein